MIVITGATGFVGAHVVERFRTTADLLLVSRDPAAGERRFSGVRVCSYDELGQFDLVDATVIHLAVRNNDRPGTAEEFDAANIDLLMSVATTAKAGGARQFINLCSTHGLQPKADDDYGLSKQVGARRLAKFWPDGAVNLYVPAIYAHEFRGRLRSLNRLPMATRTGSLGDPASNGPRDLRRHAVCDATPTVDGTCAGSRRAMAPRALCR